MADTKTSIRFAADLEGKVDPAVIQHIRLLYNAIDDHSQAFTAQSQKAQLVATISGGAITGVDVVSAGTYTKLPTVSAVGGGGSGASFRVTLNQNGGIRSVTVVNGGSGYNSPPALTVNT